MAKRDEHIKHLKKIHLFSECSKKDLNEIAKFTTEIDFPSGKVIMTEGALASSFIIIVSGTATVRRKGRKVATLGSGDFFGELAVLRNRPRSATVTVDEKMRALVVDRRQLNKLLDDIPGLAKKILYAVADRLNDLDRKAIN